MSVYLICEFTAVIILCLYLVHFFAAKQVTLDVKFTCFLSWVLGFAGVLILPFDISTVLGSNSSSDSSLIFGWSLIYWTTFIFAWVVLPIQRDFHSSGYFDFRDKLKDSIRVNLRYYALLFILLIVYMIFSLVSRHSSALNAWALLMAAGNTWGLLLLIMLAGSGTVALPRRLWDMADTDKTLRLLYLSATRVEGAMQEARFELEDTEDEVRQAANIMRSTDAQQSEAHIINTQISVLLDLIEVYHANLQAQDVTEEVNARSSRSAARNAPRSKQSRSSQRDTHAEEEQPTHVTSAWLVQLHARIKRQQWKASAQRRRWTQLQIDVYKLEEKLQQESEEMQQMRTVATETYLPSWKASMIALCSSWRCWSYRRTQLALRTVAGCLVIFSAIMLWCEMLLFSNLKSPLGYILGAYSSSETRSKTQYWGLFAALFSVLYLAACSYYSLFVLNLGWEYSLAGPQRSPTPAFLFNAEYATRLQFSLCFNFLLMVKSPLLENTAFQHIADRMPMLGTAMQTYAPIIMVLVAIITYFNAYEKLMNLIPGFESDTYATSAAEEEESIILGKKLLAGNKRSSTDRISDGHLAQLTGSGRTSETGTVLSIGAPLTFANLKVAVVKRGSALYSNIMGSGGDVGDDSHISQRHETHMVHNPLGHGTNAWNETRPSAMSHRAGLVTDRENDEEEIVFTGRYNNL